MSKYPLSRIVMASLTNTVIMCRTQERADMIKNLADSIGIIVDVRVAGQNKKEEVTVVYDECSN